MKLYTFQGGIWHKNANAFHLQVIRHSNSGSETIIDEVTKTPYMNNHGKVTICTDGLWIGEQVLIDGEDKTSYIEE